MALEEQRQRTINQPLSPERTKLLTYQITGSLTKAEQAEAKQYHLQYIRSHND